MVIFVNPPQMQLRKECTGSNSGVVGYSCVAKWAYSGTLTLHWVQTMCIQARHKMKQTLGIEQQFHSLFLLATQINRNLRRNKEHSLSLNTILHNVLQRCWGDFTRRTQTYANLHMVQFRRMFGSTRQLVPAEIWTVRDLDDPVLADILLISRLLTTFFRKNGQTVRG